MECKYCSCSFPDEDGFPVCLADPRWPAPCEYEDEEEEW